MPDENDPVLPTEYVLRRIVNQKDFYDATLDQPVVRTACCPTKNDVDGLSVFRELFVSPEEVAAAGTNPAGYYVAKLLVADILDLGLTVIPDPKPEQLEGHSLVPELTYVITHEKATKKWAKDKTRALAELAGNNIVYSPPAA